MENLILVTIAFFFFISGIDYLRGNPWNMGEYFKEGIMVSGTLIISMVGILSFSPLIGEVIGKILIPIGNLFDIDPSIFPSMFLAIDMGGLGIAKALASNMEMYIVSGVIITSTLGATISFSIPIALGLIEEKHQEDFVKGLTYGIITIPIAPIYASLILGLDIKTIIINLSPIIIMVLILSIGMIKFRSKLIYILKKIGRGIQVLSIIGLLILGILVIIGVELEGLILPLGDTLAIVGKISLFLAGAYSMIEFITDKFSNELKRLGNLIKIDKYSTSSLLSILVTNILAFKNFSKMNSRGRILCTAFSVSGAFVIGGQMGFVSTEVPDMLNIYIVSKLLAGIGALILAAIMCLNRRECISN